ncbi:MAG TPA: MerR family transcriptional regulator [Caulobacter sp.]|nr:MerR family transcriptional regulator [Caulobacter sp.]
MFARAERRAKRAGPKPSGEPVARPPSPFSQALQRLGLTATMVRHWEEAGIVEFKRVGGRRIIDDNALECLTTILQLRRAGFTIRQITWTSDILPPTVSAMRHALEARQGLTEIARATTIARAIVTGRNAT